MTDSQFTPRFDGDDGKPINKELLNYQLKAIYERLGSIEKKLDDGPSRREFTDLENIVKEKADSKDLSRLEKIVYGFCALVLIGFVTVIVNFFIRTPIK